MGLYITIGTQEKGVCMKKVLRDATLLSLAVLISFPLDRIFSGRSWSVGDLLLRTGVIIIGFGIAHFLVNTAEPLETLLSALIVVTGAGVMWVSSASMNTRTWVWLGVYFLIGYKLYLVLKNFFKLKSSSARSQ